MRVEGWRILFEKDRRAAEEKRRKNPKAAGGRDPDAEDEDDAQTLPALKKGDVCDVRAVKGREDKTKPPQFFTEGTLIAAMENIWRSFDDPKGQAMLKEAGGIGTPATRAAIIAELRRKEYLETEGKYLHCTESGLLKNLTDLDNPNSVQQMKQWLAEHGLELESLGKKEVQEQLKTAPPDLRDVLLLRQQVSKSSVKKYQAMQNAVCSDGRARGMFQFYGANRTGREAGRIIQLQNLPQNHLPDLEDARDLVKSGDLEAVELLYEDVPDTLSQLIRTAFVPKPGYQFLVADFSAIEARVIAWFAGETWRMQAFADGKDIYCASASKIFGVPVVKHGINGHLRQKGKVAELACGYSGSVGAMKAMGGAEMSDTELKQIVTDWRTASPHIVQLWWEHYTANNKGI